MCYTIPVKIKQEEMEETFMSAMAFVSITPLGKGESVSEYVSKAFNSLNNSGLNIRLTPMGTIVEGDDLNQVLTAINEAAEVLQECNRLSISIKIDYRRDRESGMDKKVDSVKNKL